MVEPEKSSPPVAVIQIEVYSVGLPGRAAYSIKSKGVLPLTKEQIARVLTDAAAGWSTAIILGDGSGEG